MLISKKMWINRIISGTWKSLFWSLLDCTLAYVVNFYLLSNFFDFPVFVPTILGTALAFFIGFINNQAYDRWWEARKIWGSLVNNSRSFSRSLLSFTYQQHESPSVRVTQMIKRHLAFVYALRNALCNIPDRTYRAFLAEGEWERIEPHHNKANAILQIQGEELQKLYLDKQIDGYQLLALNQMLTLHCDDMGASERIKNTVFPPIYNMYSRYFILIFIYGVTISIGNTIGPWSILIGTLLGYIFLTIQTIGQLLIEPFEKDNIMGIPLDAISRTIEINLLEMLHETDIPQPVISYNDEYIM